MKILSKIKNLLIINKKNKTLDLSKFVNSKGETAEEVLNKIKNKIKERANSDLDNYVKQNDFGHIKNKEPERLLSIIRGDINSNHVLLKKLYRKPFRTNRIQSQIFTIEDKLVRLYHMSYEVETLIEAVSINDFKE